MADFAEEMQQTPSVTDKLGQVVLGMLDASRKRQQPVTALIVGGAVDDEYDTGGMSITVEWLPDGDKQAQELAERGMSPLSVNV